MRLAPLACLALSACAGGLPAGTTGGSIAVAPGGRLVVVEPDAASVVLLDGDTLEAIARVAVGEEPRALLVAGDRAFVAVRGSGEVVEVALTGDPRVLRRQPVCAGPRALAATPAGEVAVACEWDGTLRALDPGTLAVAPLATELHRPVAVAAAGDAVFALESGGRLVRVAAGVVTSAALVPDDDAERPALAKMAAHAASALEIVDDGRAVAVAFELVNPTDDGNGEPIVDSYGALGDGRPKINPAVRLFSTGDLAPRPGPSTYARYDAAPELRCNGPVAIAPAPGGDLLVAHRSSADLARLDLGAGRSDGRIRATWRTGAGPAGVAVDLQRGLAWVDALDGAVTRVELGVGGAAPRTFVRAVPQLASSAALAGRRAFVDATNPHLSPSGVVACATCHPDGGDDELAWFIRAPSIPAKRRLTPHLANAGAATAPYHWDGQLPDRPQLVHATVTALMAGDALLVDGDAIAAYLDELVRAPVPPAPDDAAAVARGAAVFTRAGCAACHPPPLYTDRQLHAVLTPVGEGPDALPLADTPALRGLFLRRRFFHDGRSPSLLDLLGRVDATGHGVGLDPPARADLIAYLNSL